jgi:hypothetical protein
VARRPGRSREPGADLAPGVECRVERAGEASSDGNGSSPGIYLGEGSAMP